MSSSSEFNPPIDYNGHAHNSDQEGPYYQQQRNSKRSLRRSFERQLSDKHLKRRAQIIQMQSSSNNNNSNRRFLYQDPLKTISSSSSLHEQSQYDWHRCPGRGSFFSRRRRKRFVFVMVLLLLIFMVALPTVWYSTLLSSTTINSIPGIMTGRNSKNDSGDSGSNDSMRSYQDLADSIRSLRIRRQAQKDEAMRDWGDLQTEGQIANDDIIIFGAKDTKGNEYEVEEDDIRLKRLEQTIQRDQNEKVRQEFLLSKEDNNSNESNDTGANREKTRGRDPGHQHRNGDHLDGSDNTVRKDILMSENIAALKLFNDNKNKNAG